MEIKMNDVIKKRQISTLEKSGKLKYEKTKINGRVKKNADLNKYRENEIKDSTDQNMKDILDYFEKESEEITDEKLKNLNVKDYFDDLEKEEDYVSENKVIDLDVHNKDKKHVNLEDDEYVLEEYEDEDVYQKNENDPGFIDYIYSRISNTRSYLITPKKVEENIKSFLGQFEISKKKGRVLVRTYKMLWNAVMRTVEVLKGCEIELLDIDYYETSFTIKKNPYGSLDSDDPFYPFYYFVKEFVNYEFQKKDFYELNSKSSLLDQPLIKKLLNSFINFAKSYQGNIDKEQKVITDITNNFKKVITNDEKRVIHNLLFEYIISIRKMFDFSNCHYSFQRQLMKIDDLINLAEKKINNLNNEGVAEQIISQIDKNDNLGKNLAFTSEKNHIMWTPEKNYKPKNTKNGKKCKEMAFQKSIKKLNTEVFDCVDAPLKVDKESSSIEEAESNDYLIDNSESAINTDNNNLGYDNFANEHHLDYLDYSYDQPMALGYVKNSSQLTQSASVISGIYSFFLYFSDYFIMGFFFLLIIIIFGYLIRKTIRKRKKDLDRQYSRCRDESDLPIEGVHVIEINLPKGNLKKEKI